MQQRASVIPQAGGGGQLQPRDATETAISVGLGMLWVAVLGGRPQPARTEWLHASTAVAAAWRFDQTRPLLACPKIFQLLIDTLLTRDFADQ